MRKKVKVIILIIVLLLLVLISVIWLIKKNVNTANSEIIKNVENNNEDLNEIDLNTVEDLQNLITKVYENVEIELPRLNTTVIDINNTELLKYNTGLDSNENIESVVVSEPLMSSQAYSLVLVKIKNGTDIESIKQRIFENIDTRKWICVEADELYVTDSQNVIFLLMANEEWATPVYNSLKTILGHTGKELIK